MRLKVVFDPWDPDMVVSKCCKEYIEDGDSPCCPDFDTVNYLTVDEYVQDCKDHPDDNIEYDMDMETN